ncbi:MAG TPA: hypothetical protein VL284_00585, partial [Thermoanaerobaculia bacterium]|nr:hypothetical protein [Thermoanaerobaculia bacterium]
GRPMTWLASIRLKTGDGRNCQVALPVDPNVGCTYAELNLLLLGVINMSKLQSASNSTQTIATPVFLSPSHLYVVQMYLFARFQESAEAWRGPIVMKFSN